MYGHLLKPEGRAIDVIDHTEGTDHAVVRVKNPDAKPPKLKTQRLSPNEVLLVCTSPRQMCGLAIGIGTGLGQHFQEKIIANQTMCCTEERLAVRFCFGKPDRDNNGAILRVQKAAD
jgi:hypothetical protein